MDAANESFEISARQKNYQFVLDVDVKKRKGRPLFSTIGKTLYNADWLPSNDNRPEILIMKVDGARAKKQAAFYVELSRHPHVVRTFGFVIENDNNATASNSIMLLQEYAPEGSLYEMLVDCKTMPTEAMLIEIFLQIIDAMTYLAYNGVVHGDLACRNVLVFHFDEKDPKKILVKVTDFGLSRYSKLYSVAPGSARTTLNIIPTRYAAPEILSQNVKPDDYTEKSDVFSMGVLMWEAYSRGALPWGEIERDDLVVGRVMNGDLLPRPANCSEGYWSIITKTWSKLPKDRPTFSELRRLLIEQHYRSGVELQPPKTSKQPPQHSNPKLEKIIKDNTNQTLLNLREEWLDSKDMEIVVYHALQTNQVVTTLILSRNPIGVSGIRCLTEALLHNKTVTTLDLSTIGMEDEAAQYLGEMLRCNTTITTLNLSRDQFTDNGLRHLSEGLQHNTTLTTLILNYIQLRDLGAQHLSEALRYNKALGTLDLGDSTIGDNGLRHLSRGLQYNTTLKTLKLSRNNIGDGGIEHLSEGLHNNKALTTLDLSTNSIGDKGARHLGEVLRRNTVLTTLILGDKDMLEHGGRLMTDSIRNTIGDEGARHLGEALRHNAVLRTLDLSKNRIASDGAKHLGNGLRYNKTLKTLDLSDNRIEVGGAQQLIDALQHHMTLTRLHLRGNWIEETERTDLDELRKNKQLEIRW